MNKNIITVSVVVFLSVISGVAYADISATEREALIDLYNSTNGDNWANNSGWKEPPLHSDGFAMPGTECSSEEEQKWHGVFCNSEKNHVEELNLQNNELSGNIPASIRNLSYLWTLHLEHNHLAGIPLELGELINLEYLYLNNSHLNGEVPTTLLKLLNLADNGSDFSNNSLCTSNPELLTFLNQKQSGGDWQAGQQIDISSVIIILQVIAGFQTEERSPGCDINADNRIGLEEAIYILQKISELR